MPMSVSLGARCTESATSESVDDMWTMVTTQKAGVSSACHAVYSGSLSKSDPGAADVPSPCTRAVAL